MLLDKADAGVAGKRLDYQAQRVRSNLAHATETAEVERAVLAEQAADLTPAEVEQARAQIDREERRVHGYHRNEVYVGINEMEALLPRADALAVAQPHFPAWLEQESRVAPGASPQASSSHAARSRCRLRYRCLHGAASPLRQRKRLGI